jgi:hypothetical protein
MAEAFGAVQVEKELSAWLAKTFNMDLIHMKMGGTVYQIVKPGTAIPEWTEQLEQRGPCISNVSWQIHGAHAFAQKLRDMGMKECHD